MKIKPMFAGLIIATSMIAVVGTSQATCHTCSKQAEFSGVGPGFSGTGWHMIPCKTSLQPAQNWGQYDSGSYAPPVTGRGILFLQ